MKSLVFFMIESYYEIEDIMAILRVKSRMTIYEWLKKGKLHARRLHPRKQVIDKEELQRFIRDNNLDVEVIV